jgi:uncharacterized membrane protein
MARGTLVVYLFSTAYALVFFAAAASSYVVFLTPRFDLGDMTQVVWSTAHGHFLQTNETNGVVMSSLGAHFDPFLALLAPLWWIWASPLVLLAAQAFAVASGALPVYWLARKHLQSGSFAAVFAAAYLLYSPTQFNAFSPYGIHAVSFAIPLILFAIWFLDEGRLFAFAACALVAVTTKEEIAAAVGGLGVWWAVRRGGRWVGGSVAVAGVASSVVILEFVVPHFAPSGTQPFADRYAGVGSTPVGVARAAVTDPATLLHQAATWHNFGFLLLVFGPFLGLWALEPWLLVGAVPDLAINLLSSDSGQTTITGHYTAGIIPFVVAASVLGTARLRSKRLLPPALIGVAFMLAVLSPLVYAGRLIAADRQDEVRAMQRAVRLIPSNAPVSAARSLGGNVSTRRVVVTFPAVARAQWVLIGPISPLESEAAFRKELTDLRSSARWTRVFNKEGIELFKRNRR